MLESGPTRHNAQGLHVGVAGRATGAYGLAWGKLVGELSVRHVHFLINCGGSTTLSVTDKCHEPGGDTNKPVPDPRLRILTTAHGNAAIYRQ
jgi:hypothetical protein